MLSSGRRVRFARVYLIASRRMFVEEALVRRRPALPFAFLDRNASTRARLDRVEAVLRRRDLLAADDALVQFYLERLPPEVASTRAFERWWRDEERSRPRLLDADENVFLIRPLPEVRPDDYPAQLDVQGNALPLSYRFDTAAPDDGATLHVPLALVRALDVNRLEWLVPGWLREKVIHLMRGLPKNLRRELVPVPGATDRFLGTLGPFAEGSLFQQLAEFVTQAAGAVVEPADIAAIILPAWLRFNLRVVDASGRVLHESRDLDILHDELRSQIGATPFGGSVHEWERAGVRTWDFGSVPEEVRIRSGSLRLRAYPGLKDEDASVRLRLFTSPLAARRSSYDGLVRHAALALPQQHELVRRSASVDREFTLLVAAAGFGRELLAEIADRAVAEAVFGAQGRTEDEIAAAVRDRATFDECVDRGRAQVVDRGVESARVVRAVLLALKDVRRELGALPGPVFGGTRQSVIRQTEKLLEPGWIRRTPQSWWPQMPKYVRAMVRRLERGRGDVERDRKLHAQVAVY
ncbi:MAG: DUF3418 domain-containing protein, partial [Steroidobacteraceae bacterium]